MKQLIYLSFSSTAILIAIFCTSISARADDGLGLVPPGAFSRNSTNTSSQNSAEEFQARTYVPKQSNYPLSATVNNNAVGDQLTTVQLQRLASHDIVLLVDKSGSMATADCPLSSGGSGFGSLIPELLLGQGLCTRWDWCLKEMTRMIGQTERVLPNGFTVVLFDSRFMIFPHVTVPGLVQIFRTNQPWGGTDLALPLESVFSDYFNRKTMTHGGIKPLLIGVITDGCPNSPKKAREAIINATHLMHNANEITIIFFLIGGHDWSGEKFVEDLCNKLESKGASFSIVKAVSFHDLKNTGLARALADNLQ